jgi:hypothetical protein
MGLDSFQLPASSYQRLIPLNSFPRQASGSQLLIPIDYNRAKA